MIGVSITAGVAGPADISPDKESDKSLAWSKDLNPRVLSYLWCLAKIFLVISDAFLLSSSYDY